jgi:hypothetical protein
MDQATLTFPQMLSEKQAARMLSVSVAAYGDGAENDGAHNSRA